MTSLKSSQNPQWKDEGTYKEPQPSTDNIRVPRLEIDGSTTYIDKDGSNNMTLTDAVTGTKTLAELSAAGSGDVTGPASSTDHAIARFDSTTGKILLNSGVTIADDNTVNFVGGVMGNVHSVVFDELGAGVTAADHGVLYTKADNLLYFGSGDQATHVVATLDTKLDDFTATDDNTDLDATTEVHGLMPKADKTKLDGVAAGADVTGDNAPQAHKDSHDPSDGSDALDCAAAGEIVGVAAAAEGSAHSFARSDHTHQVQASIADDHILTVDDAAAADNDFARFTAAGIEGLTVAESIAALLGAALPENTAIILDAALSADGKYSGITETGTAGAILAFGDVIYQAVADNKWELAKADAITTSIHKIGICVAAAAEDAATTILLIGKVRADTAFPTFTAFAPVYISSGTAGDLTSTCPSKSTGHVVRVVGQANSGDELWFNPDNDWLVYA